AAMIALLCLGLAFQPDPLSFAPAISNPLGIALAGDLDLALGLIGFTLLFIVVGACVASVIVRFRRAQGVERQQLKWFAYASIPLIIVIAANPFQSLLDPAQQAAYDVLFRLSVATLPVAAGVAIL